MAAICYQQETITAEEFAALLQASGLAQRRPADDLERLQRMLDHANLTITARREEDGGLVGIARSLTDWSFATYLSDLAVDAAMAGQGIGRQLIEETRQAGGRQATLLLIAAPDAVSFYERIEMPRCERAFVYERES
ncbi:MAG: GNAT family N-acetyltransferase [Pseudomonadota bacterium]